MKVEKLIMRHLTQPKLKILLTTPVDNISELMGNLQRELSDVGAEASGSSDDKTGSGTISFHGRHYTLSQVEFPLPESEAAFVLRYLDQSGSLRASFEAHSAQLVLTPAQKDEHHFQAIGRHLDFTLFAQAFAQLLPNSLFSHTGSKRLVAAKEIKDRGAEIMPMLDALYTGKQFPEKLELLQKFWLYDWVQFQPFGTAEQAGVRTLGLACYLPYDLQFEPEVDIERAINFAQRVAVSCVINGITLDFGSLEGASFFGFMVRQDDNAKELIRVSGYKEQA